MLFSKISSVLILLLFVRDFAIAVTFGRHYEGVRFVTYAAPSKDKGYLIALTDGTIPVVQKINAAGKTVWTISFEDEVRGAGQIYKILELRDNGMLFIGSEHKNGKDFPMLFRTDAFTEPVWYKVVTGKNSDYLFDVVPVDDSGFLLAGCTKSFSANQFCDGWLMMIDAGGTELWSKRFAGKFDDVFYRIIPVQNGFIVSGTVDSKANIYSKGVVLKIDSQGNVLWRKTYKNPNGHLRIWSVSADDDGSLVLTGGYFPNGSVQSDLLVMGLTASGNLKWKKLFAGAGSTNSEEGYSITKSKPSGFVIAGETRKPGIFDIAEGTLIKIDQNGNPIWGRKFDGDYEDALLQVECTADGGYILVAIQTLVLGLSDYYFAVLKVNQTGVIPGCSLFKTLKLSTIDAVISESSAFLPGKKMRANPRTVRGQLNVGTARQRKLCP